MILTLLLTLQPFICSQCARNYREPKILTSLHANKWACTASWDAGGRHKSRRLEMRTIAHTSDLQFHGETLLPCQETNWPFATRYSLCFSRSLANILGKLVVQLLNRVWLFVTPWSATHQTPLSFTVSWNLLKLTSVELMMPSNHLIFCHPLLLLPSILPNIRVFSHQAAKVLELQHQSFRWMFRADFLLDWLVWSPCCPSDSQELKSSKRMAPIPPLESPSLTLEKPR